MKTRSLLCFALWTISLSFVPSSSASAQDHVLATPEEAHWRASTMLPAGTQVAVLSGDPSKAGPFVVRIKFPPHFAVPAHWHPADEHVVVTSGALTFGMGDKLDRSAATNRTLSAGGFALMPATMHHFAFTGEEETTVVMFAEGPLQIHYISPADDPRTH